MKSFPLFHHKGQLPLLLGHRGSRQVAGYPENTIPAFREAIDLGANGIELDVRLTRDNQLVVYHDRSLFRLNRLREVVRSVDSSRLGHMPFRDGSGNVIFPEIEIPLLKDVFRYFRDEIYYNVEVKWTRVSYRLLAEQLFRLISENNLQERTWVSSFDIRFLWKWGELNTGIPGAYLFEKLNIYSRRNCRQKYVDMLHPTIKLICHLPELTELSKPLCFWTVNSEVEFNVVKQANVFGVITDNIKQVCGIFGL